MFKRLPLLGGLLVLSLALLGCGTEDAGMVADDEPASGHTPTATDPASEPEDGPFDPETQVRPDLIRVEPAEARAGDEVELYFPDETDRGVAYVLEERVGDAWELRYYLSAAAEGYAGSPWWRSLDEPRAPWDDIGISGPGPDIVPVPETAEAGVYRVCTANAESNFCAELVVVE